MKVLSKSRFKLGLECPNKLYYTGKPAVFPNKKSSDTFLLALANGGFQVEELARMHYPGGIFIDAEPHEYQKASDLTRNEEMTLLKKYGTPDPRKPLEYQNPAIATLVSRVNATFTHGFQQFQADESWAKETAKAYFVKGTRELVLGLNRNRVYFADCWMDAFSEEFEWMQRM